MPVVKERDDTAVALVPPVERQSSHTYSEMAPDEVATSYWAYQAALAKIAGLRPTFAEQQVAALGRAASYWTEVVRAYLANSAASGELSSAEPQLGSSDHLGTTRRRLSQLARLEHDWDSYGADPISAEAMRQAQRFLILLEEILGDALGEMIRPHSVAPLADGGLQLEWRSSNSAVEFEFGPQGEIGYLLVKGSEPNRTFHEDDGISLTDGVQLLGRVLLA